MLIGRKVLFSRAALLQVLAYPDLVDGDDLIGKEFQSENSGNEVYYSA